MMQDLSQAILVFLSGQSMPIMPTSGTFPWIRSGLQLWVAAFSECSPGDSAESSAKSEENKLSCLEFRPWTVTGDWTVTTDCIGFDVSWLVTCPWLPHPFSETTKPCLSLRFAWPASGIATWWVWRSLEQRFRCLWPTLLKIEGLTWLDRPIDINILKLLYFVWSPPWHLYLAGGE